MVHGLRVAFSCVAVLASSLASAQPGAQASPATDSSTPRALGDETPAPGTWSPVPPVRFDGQVVARVVVRDRRDLVLLEQVSGDCWSDCYGLVRSDGTADYRLRREDLRTLEAAGIAYVIVIPDVQAVVDAERQRLNAAQAGPFSTRAYFDDYQPLATISAYVNTLVATRPDMVTRFSIGTSVQNRDLFAMRITEPGSNTAKPTLFLHGLQHAREWITGSVVMYLADHLVRNYNTDPRVRDALSRYNVVILPVMNPDGYVHTWTNNRYWRKNRRQTSSNTFGIDLNRNWGETWGSNNGSSGNLNSDTYRGPAAFSEPETLAVSRFIASNPDVIVHWDVHSFGKYILYPFGYSATPAPNAGEYARLSAAMEAAFEAPFGEPYTAGPAYTTLYPVSGGSSDWSQINRGILAWVLELRGTDFVLPPGEIIPNSLETLGAFFALVNTLCQADLNNDAFVDDADFVLFAQAYELFTDRRGDLNGDALTDDADFVLFAEAYERFTCP